MRSSVDISLLLEAFRQITKLLQAHFGSQVVVHNGRGDVHRLGGFCDVMPGVLRGAEIGATGGGRLLGPFVVVLGDFD